MVLFFIFDELISYGWLMLIFHHFHGPIEPIAIVHGPSGETPASLSGVREPRWTQLSQMALGRSVIHLLQWALSSPAR